MIEPLEGKEMFDQKELKQGTRPAYLYIAEYFVNHQVIQHPIYAENLDQAVLAMNAFYAENGKGHAHKSLERHTTGIEIEGTYYLPQI